MDETLAKDGVSDHRDADSSLGPLEQNTHECTSTTSRVMPLASLPTQCRSNSKPSLNANSMCAEGDYMQETRTESPRRELDGQFEISQQSAGDDMAFEDIPSYASRAFYRSRPSRPLIDLVKNEWRTDPKYGQTHSHSPERSFRSRWTHSMTPRRIQRYLLVYLLLVSVCWLSWKWYLEPQWEEHLLLSESLNERINTGKGWFGSNKMPAFNDMVQLKTLNKKLVPGAGSRTAGRRLVIVGDVHGCKDECRFRV